MGELTNERAKEIWAGVKANMAKLDACRGHSFSVDLNPERAIGKRWACAHCQGEVGATDKAWYERGLRAGSPSEHALYVPVSLELLDELGEWSQPVRVKILRRAGNELALVMERAGAFTDE